MAPQQKEQQQRQGLREPLLAPAAAAAARTGSDAHEPLPIHRSVSVLVEDDGPRAGGAGSGDDDDEGECAVGEGCGGAGGAPPDDTFGICAFNLCKVIMGAGMMAMPRALLLLGLVPGTALVGAMGWLTYATLARGLIYTSDCPGLGTAEGPGGGGRGGGGGGGGRQGSYGALARRVLGPRAEAVLQLAVFVNCWVMQVVFLVVIGDILIGEPPEFHGLIRELTGLASGPATSRPAVLGALCLAVLLPLGSLRSMNRLAAVNVVGVASNGVFAALMLVLAAAAAARGTARPLPLWPRWDELRAGAGGRVGAALVLASTLPVLLNCFACHQSLHPLLPSLRPYSTRRAQRMVATALTIAGCIYYVIAVCACAVFGGSLHDDVLSDVTVASMAPLLGGEPAAHAAALTVRVGYLLSLTGSFVLLLFPLRHVIADVALGGHDALHSRWLPVTAALTASVFAVACFLPSIWGALDLVGSTATTAQSWVVPALLILAVERAAAARARAAAAAAAAEADAVEVAEGPGVAAANGVSKAGAAGAAAGAGAGGASVGWRLVAAVLLVIGAFMFLQATAGPLAAWLLPRAEPSDGPAPGQPGAAAGGLLAALALRGRPAPAGA